MKKSPIVRAGLAASVLLLALAILVPSLAGGAAKSNKALVAAHGKALAEMQRRRDGQRLHRRRHVVLPRGRRDQGPQGADRTLRRLRQAAFGRRPLWPQGDPGARMGKRQHLLREVQGDGAVPRQAYFSTDGYVFKGGKIAAEMRPSTRRNSNSRRRSRPRTGLEPSCGAGFTARSAGCSV